MYYMEYFYYMYIILNYLLKFKLKVDYINCYIYFKRLKFINLLEI